MVSPLLELYEVITDVLRHHNLSFTVSSEGMRGFEMEVYIDETNNGEGIIDLLNNEIYGFTLTHPSGDDITSKIEKSESASQGNIILTLRFRIMG